MSMKFELLVVIYLLALLGRIAYDRLKQLGRVESSNSVILVLVVVDMGVLWSTWFNLCENDASKLGLPAWVSQLGLALTLLGVCLFLGALAQLRAVENTKHLVTTGLFRLTRHPVYTGFACWYLGWPLYLDKRWSLFLGILNLGAVVWWRLSEERALLKQFGQAYRDYQRRTWL